MARPTALAPLGALLRGLGSTLEGIGAGIADTASREKRQFPTPHSTVRYLVSLFSQLEKPDPLMRSAAQA